MKIQALVTHVVVLLVYLYHLKQYFCAWNHVLQTYICLRNLKGTLLTIMFISKKIMAISSVIITLFVDDIIWHQG
jgi:hypothetical protein